MLENLDKIDWSKLHHAYGTAEDVPDLLRALASPDEEVRDETYEMLYSNIYHQGTVYEASGYAVPFLIELVQQPAVEEKDRILGLLASIAHGNSYHAAHASFSMFKEQSQTEEYQHEVEIELSWVRQAYLAVQVGIPVYYNLINHPDSAVREAIADLLLTFTEKNLAATSAQILSTRFNQEDNPNVRNSLINGLGYLCTPDSSETQLLYQVVADQKESLYLRQIAAYALATILGPDLPERAVEILIRVSYGYNALSKIGIERGTPALARMLIESDIPREALYVARSLLNLTFEQQRVEICSQSLMPNIGGRAYYNFSIDREAEQTIKAELENGLDKLKASLNEWQQQAVAAIVNTDALWEIDTNLYLAFRLPITREELRSLL